jgi:Cu/Ag efflux protein CusF
MKRLVTLAAASLAATALWAQAPTTDAEVIKIDKASAKITLKHAEIKNLDMPAMTMAFRVADAKMLDSVSPGDRVRFAADKLGGSYTVTVLVRSN